MTEDIGSDASKRPHEVEIALMKQRIRASESRDTKMVETLDEIVDKLSKIETSLALGGQRMDQIDEHLKSTDKNVTTIATEVSAIHEDKRSAGALIAGVLSFIGTAATAIWVGFKS